jgi:hypothetical protein
MGEAAVSHGRFFVFMVLYSQAAKVTGERRSRASDFLPDKTGHSLIGPHLKRIQKRIVISAAGANVGKPRHTNNKPFRSPVAKV